MEQPSNYIQSCYDAVAQEYANRYADELSHKPLDRELLTRFASEVPGKGPVYDLGCGPGQTTLYLQQSGVAVCGIDLSEELLHQARRLHPEVPFAQGDMLALPCSENFLTGVVAFYAIVHFSQTQLQLAFNEMYRVLQPGGLLLVSFHIGHGSLHVAEFLGRVAIDFMFFQPQCVTEALVRAGFESVEVIQREPYPDVEYPSRRAYVFARKAV